jgi:protocatechuate 3,4-dioxygenase, alpha subunit
MSFTPSQTVGPFFHIGFDRLYVNDLTTAHLDGERVTLSGKIFDGDSKPITDAVMEIWQADAQGQYTNSASAKFKGYGRCATDEHGAFSFVTIKPGRVLGTDGALQAPHIAVSIFMRGLLKRLVTRIYFADEVSNKEDAVLQSVASERRATLLAKRIAPDATKLEWNIVVQGQNETVFFEC